MYLKYIEIHGFKSFPDKTRIEFQKGLTAIVGPNGSGKSNISDAIRWVLGEQSSKSLRGTKMEDVIFDGSKNRGAMGYASVALCLDNTDGRIADVGDSLLIGRRYYRSGDSEYTINGAAARLRDVREMFMDTGLGRDGYSIIGQGRIDAIVSAKSTERREIFEEASGIAKYRFRKTEAEHKLELAEENIERLKDIIDELKNRVGPLETQSRKAKEFLALSEHKRGMEITLYCDTIRRSRELLKEQDDKTAISKSDYEALCGRLTELDNTLEHNAELMRRYSSQIDSCNAEINVLLEKQGVIEGEQAVMSNDLAYSKAEYERLTAELASFGEAGSALVREKSELEAEIAAKNELLAKADADIELAAQQLNSVILSGESSDRERTESAAKLAQESARLADLRVDEVSHKSRGESAAKRADALDGLVRANAAEVSELKKRVEESDSRLSGVKAEIARIENIKSGYAMKLAAKNDVMKQVNDSLNRAVFASGECSHRIKVLSELENEMEGFDGSVKRVVSAKNNRELRGIVGTVASLLTIKSGCETAIEAALGGALQNIVVEDESAAKSAISFLKDTRAGRATFLPLNTIKGRDFDGDIRGDGILGLASGLVSADGRYGDIINSLLGRIIVAKELDYAAEAAKRNRYRFKVVTLDGQIVNAGGSFTGGYIAKGTGVLSRRSEIDALNAKLTGLTAEIDKLKASAAAEAAEAAKISAELTALDSDLINKGEERARAAALAEGAAAQYSAALTAGEALAAEKQATEVDISECARLAGECAELAAKTAERCRLLEQSAAQNSPADYIEKRAAAQEKLSELKLARIEVQKDAENLKAELDKLGTRGEDMNARRLDAQRLAGIAKQMYEAKGEELERKKREVAAAASDIEYKRAEISDCVEKRLAKEGETTRLRAEERDSLNTREELSREMARLEERRAALEQDHERTVARLWEDYELTPAEAQGACVPFERVGDLKKEVGELRQRIRALGHVNVGAIDEYKEVSERYEFLKAQYADVNDSRSELIRLIESLTGEMRGLFSQSFARISEHFSRIFTELFGGGSAKIYLTDDQDVLESGIEIDAHPPGKVIKNLLSLSGGEKALVAIALYFAILAVNPSPFCVLDEIDTALDDSNVLRFAGYINRIADKTQFFAITHRRGTMENAGVLYGVTMQEEGVSKLIRLDVESVDATLIR